ncbi:MAG: guanylate kinase [Clostridia bacterium]|nr:guanylate kinase [Clostridia bacterium]
MTIEQGKLVVVSGPSGAGKSTVISELMRADSNVVFSVSATTRRPRPGETEGVQYFFVDKPRFEQMIANGELLEYASYVDNYYGTPAGPVSENIAAGKDVIFDIDVNGAMQIKQKCPEAILIFIIPSSFSEIEKRLHSRGTDSEEVIKQRVQTARTEYLMATNYEYIVINDDPLVAANEIESIITAGKCRVENRKKYLNEVCSL